MAHHPPRQHSHRPSSFERLDDTAIRSDMANNKIKFKKIVMQNLSLFHLFDGIDNRFNAVNFIINKLSH